MTAQEYLGQAYRLDQRINSKLEQVLSLRGLTTKATATMSDMPGGGSRNVYKMQDIIAKIVDLEDDINRDIDALVDGRKLMALPRYPVSGAVYDYLPSGAASYQLCATFEAASSGDPPDSFWAHEAGYVCFRLNPGYGNN